MFLSPIDTDTNYFSKCDDEFFDHTAAALDVLWIVIQS